MAKVADPSDQFTAFRQQAQHSTAQHSTAQHSTAQHSTAQHSSCETYDHHLVQAHHRPCSTLGSVERVGAWLPPPPPPLRLSLHQSHPLKANMKHNTDNSHHVPISPCRLPTQSRRHPATPSGRSGTGPGHRPTLHLLHLVLSRQPRQPGGDILFCFLSQLWRDAVQGVPARGLWSAGRHLILVGPGFARLSSKTRKAALAARVQHGR
jgi:hypothetical protein